MENIEKCLDQFFAELQHTPGPWAHDDGHIFTEEKKREYNSIARIYEIYDRYGKPEVNHKLILQSPSMLRELCRAYLTLLVKFGYGVNETVTSIRTTIWMQSLLASLCGQISEATRLEAKHIQDTFEQYATWINMHEDIPDDTHHTQSA